MRVPFVFHWVCSLCEKQSYRPFQAVEEARVDMLRHARRLHPSRELVPEIVEEPYEEPLVVGPFVAVCGICKGVVSEKPFPFPDEADEHAELHRRSAHGQRRVVLAVLPAPLMEDPNDGLREVLEMQARADAQPEAAFKWHGGPMARRRNQRV